MVRFLLFRFALKSHKNALVNLRDIAGIYGNLYQVRVRGQQIKIPTQ